MTTAVYKEEESMRWYIVVVVGNVFMQDNHKGLSHCGASQDFFKVLAWQVEV